MNPTISGSGLWAYGGSGTDPEPVLEELSRILPGDVRAFTKAQLIDRDLAYWRTGTPISVILLVGVALGFAVGVVICYQILYTEVLDHLAEFATLKAMGYGDRYIQWVVISESVLLSVLGFIPSIGNVPSGARPTRTYRYGSTVL